MLKKCAEVLAAPICALINNSFMQGLVPTQWKISRISPIPKCIPVCDIETDLRPVAITCPVAKIAEVFASRLFDDFYDEDVNQFGTVSGRSTTLALVKLTNLLYESSDVSGSIIRILFIDFSRAFDIIDHNIISKKLEENICPDVLKNWLLSFLTNRTQFVKVDNYTSSSCLVNAGAPQGTRAGPNCFKLLIKDLTLSIPCIKYVDDVTVLSVSNEPCDSSLQLALNNLLIWCDKNGMRLNVKKTKEMLITFGCKQVNCLPLTTANGVIDRVTEFKLLGVIISSDLTWNKHVNYIVSRASKRLFAICQLVRCGFSSSDIISVYCSLIRPILEYSCQVWHSGLTLRLSDEIESVQRRCLRIIFPQLSYADALFVAGLQRLDDRREQAVVKLFNEMKCPAHILHGLLPTKPSRLISVTRDVYPYELRKTRTLRGSRSMIAYCVRRRF